MFFINLSKFILTLSPMKFERNLLTQIKSQCWMCLSLRFGRLRLCLSIENPFTLEQINYSSIYMLDLQLTLFLLYISNNLSLKRKKFCEFFLGYYRLIFKLLALNFGQVVASMNRPWGPQNQTGSFCIFNFIWHV